LKIILSRILFSVWKFSKDTILRRGGAAMIAVRNCERTPFFFPGESKKKVCEAKMPLLKIKVDKTKSFMPIH